MHPMAPTCRTLLVEDDGDIAALVTAVLDIANDDFEVVGVVESADDALEVVASAHPDVVLLDGGIGGRSGVDVARDLLASYPHLAIILFSAHIADDTAAAAMRVGVRECVEKVRVMELPTILQTHRPN